MRRLHLYNPENDLALALGCRNYTPPPNADALRRAGALLPMWWAIEGDEIIAPSDYQGDADWLRRHFGLCGEIFSGGNSRLVPSPWGWSADACRRFESAGVPATLLPGRDAVERMRALSHRRSSISLLSEMNRSDLLPVETTDPDVVVEMERNYPGTFVKSPWSCSGRGVFCASGIDAATLRAKASGIIHRQGSVMVERGVKGKVADCASLFYIAGGEVEFRGYSLFHAEDRGVYAGNIVASQQWLKGALTKYIPTQELENTVEEQRRALQRLIRDAYTGWVGIDMMVSRSEADGFALHPCIELNLRMTMGVVAMKVAERLAPATPHIISWRRGAPQGLSLLPPRHGFALCLTAI